MLDYKNSATVCQSSFPVNWLLLKHSAKTSAWRWNRQPRPRAAKRGLGRSEPRQEAFIGLLDSPLPGCYSGAMSAPLRSCCFAVLACILLSSLAPPAAEASAVERIRQRGVLLWGSDSQGGAPYVFPDPKDPSRLIGFELDIAEDIARELGVRQRLVQTAWDSLVPALERGDFDLALDEVINRLLRTGELKRCSSARSRRASGIIS